MLRPLALILVLSTAPALADEAADGAPARPGDPHGAAPLWDGVAECASILAVASSRATSRIDRDGMKAAAGQWFAKSGDMAAADDALPETEEWAALVAGWAGQIGSLSSLSRMPDWMSYCAWVASQTGLNGQVFASRAPAPAPAAEATDS